MLRITLPDYSGHGVFVLEGKLTGLWTQELLRVARETNQLYGNTFDLREVFYVDSAGEEALRILNRFGARFIADSAYGKYLCKRLKLHRVAASEVYSLKTDGSSGNGNGQPAHVKKPNPLTNAADGRRPPESGE
jgi:hypothetical protein